jgi:hypothetical protein
MLHSTHATMPSGTRNHRLSLNQQLWTVWKRLRRRWTGYLKKTGLDLEGASNQDLPRRLLEPIKIRFDVGGLEELSRTSCRGVEPGDPARSLFYHVLASPHVLLDGTDDKHYPTIADLNVVENFIFASAPFSIPELRRLAGLNKLAIAVFAYEYATAGDTVHRRHADMCFSRTGISRVGNGDPHYLGKSRGYFPSSGKKRKVHVVPARFGAFIAVRRHADSCTFGPLGPKPRDDERTFWVPVHKLFNGSECVEGVEIELSFTTEHFNSKLKRIHLALRNEGIDTGWKTADLDDRPFTLHEGLATFDPESGLLAPVPHKLIEPAYKDGKPVGFLVPPKHSELGALHFADDLDVRHWPEFVHVKHAIQHGKVVYLPDVIEESLKDYVTNGGYTAATFLDYTADGFVDLSCPALAAEIPRHVAAYSVLGQPDFFPLVKQQDLMEWSESTAPHELRNKIWPDRDTPSPLSESRIPANITLPGAKFDSTDQTISAVVGMDRAPGPVGRIDGRTVRRESTLSYRATNLFEPGWDTSEDFNRDERSKHGTFHMANYGLGSPYAEDTLICAAAGSFWPGAVPDNTRFFAPGAYPSVTPIPDGEAGWDRVPRPNRKGKSVEYLTFEYADYVKAICDESFDYERFANITLEDYIARTLVVARIFQHLGVSTRAERAPYGFVSFRLPTEAEFRRLEDRSILLDRKRSYRVLIGRATDFGKSSSGKPQVTTVTPQEFILIYADPQTVAREDSTKANGWTVQRF